MSLSTLRIRRLLSREQRSTIALFGLVFVGSILMTIALTMLTACGGAETLQPESGPIKVLSASPKDSTYFTKEPLRLHFDRPVIGEDELGAISGPLPIDIEPAVAVTARFLDRQTLVVTPNEALAPSTRYRVRLLGSLGERTGGFVYEFTSVPLEIEGVWGLDLSALPATPKLPVHFNQPISEAEVARRCRFASKTELKTVDVVAEARGKQGVGSVIGVSPKTPLELDSNYQLLCSGLTGVGGTEPMTGLYALDIKTYPKLTVSGFTPSPKQTLYADRTRIEISFSNKIDLDSLRENIRIEPAVKDIDFGWLSYRGTRYVAEVDLDVKKTYKLTIAKDATDRFGQKLGEAHVVTLKTGNARPRISMETGIYAVEPTAGGYPVWSRNVSEMSLECAKVPATSVVKLLTSSMDYDPWYDASSHSIPWQKLGLTRRTRILRPTAKENSWHLSRLDLEAQCAATDKSSTPAKGGIYLAEIRSPDVTANNSRRWAYRASRRVLANNTDLGVLLKAGPASGLVWVTQISTGKPVAGAVVEIFSPKGERVFRGRSDRSGILKTPGSTKLLKRKSGETREYWSYRSQRLIAVVKKAGDMAVVDGNWANGIQTWNFGVREDRKAGETKIRGFIQSDRGIYRPGETVHFKGLIREFRSARAPRIPQKRELTLLVTDARGATVYEQKHALSQFGGFDLEHVLPKTAAVGDYLVTAKHGEHTFRERFSVEEFRKVTFETTVDKLEKHQRLGQKLSFATKTDYLFGAPVSSANVEWDVTRRPRVIRFAKLPGYGFADYAAKGYYGYWGYDGNRYKSFVASGNGKTDKAGRFAFDVAEKGSNLSSPQDYIAQVTVTDESDQSVTKRVAVTAHPTEFYLGLHAQEFVQAVDMPFAINAVAIEPDGNQRTTKAKLTLVRESRSCSWEKRGYRSVAKCEKRHKVVLTRRIKLPKTGVATERIVAKKPGDYIVRIEATDGRGKKVASSTYVWILGKGEAFWSGDESARMSLIASKVEYKPGETARLVPRTGLKKPTALITLERDGIIDAFVREMDSPYEGIEVPLSGTHAPNVFASVAMVSGRHGKGDRNRPRFKMGVVDLRVSSEANRLAVTINTEKPSYEPGELVKGVVSVTSNGRPIRSEVAVSVADEGVLALIGYQTPDPMKSFYKSWGLGIDNGTNWNRISRLAAPGAADPDAGGDAGDANAGVRSKFVNSAFWAPALVTNSRGQARFEFRAPDNLTAFRVMAVAADMGSRFGSSDSRITIAKPLLGKEVLPRLLTQNDRAEVGVMVHNNTGKDGIVTVRAKASGADVTPARQTVRVAAGSRARARFFATAKTEKAASFEFALSMARHRDALRVEIPVSRPIATDDALIARAFLGNAGDRHAGVKVSWPEKSTSESELSLTVDRTGLAELEPSLRALIEYPYGCLEQTLSRFIPLTKVADLASSLGLDSLKGPKLGQFLDAGAAKVVRHQKRDGHFSLWPGGPSYPHLTAYALFGLKQARDAGTKIDESAYRRGIAAVKKYVSSTLTTEMDYGTAAMSAMLLAEAGQADAGLNARLYSRRKNLPVYGRAFLLMAMHHANGDLDLRRNLAGELEVALGDGVAKESAKQVQVMGSDVRSTAIAISALLLHDKRSPVIEKTITALKAAQKPSGRWYTTQENVYGLIALSDYARTRKSGNSRVMVSMNGKVILDRRLRGNEVASLTLAKKDVTGELTIEARGPINYVVRRRSISPVDYSKPASNGFTVTRQLLDPASGKQITRPQVGQILVAKVTVKTDQLRRWVALVDPFPAGLEPLNTKLATTRRSQPSAAEKSRSWRDRWDHIELRDGEARAFRDVLPAGETTLTYRVRVTMPGVFTAMPAHVEEMYEPQVSGRTQAKVVEVVR